MWQQILQSIHKSETDSETFLQFAAFQKKLFGTNKGCATL